METFPPTDAETYRALARVWAASVTIVSGRRHQGVRPPEKPELDGFTATAFLTVSIHPPIILVSAARNSGAHALLSEVEVFTVNLLASDQEEHAAAFARTQAERGDAFQRFAWKPDAAGVPILEGALGAFSAKVRSRIEAGDHTLILGDVTAIHRGPRLDSLVYHNRAFRSLQP